MTGDIVTPGRSFAPVGGRHDVTPVDGDYRLGAVLTFAWPKSPIPANGQRGHWSTHARRVREVRAVAAALGRVALGSRGRPAYEHAEVWLQWRPTIARRRDADNLVPLMKALVDGLVEAAVIPDDNDTVLRRHMPRIVLDPTGPARFELTIRPTERNQP